MNKKNGILDLKNGFTMIELTIGLTIFSFVIVGLLMILNRTYSFAQFSKVEIMGINLAREGMEEMYNIRDTNWKKYSSDRDNCWLNMDPLGDCTNTSAKINFGSGLFILQTKTSNAGQVYFAVSDTNIDIESGYNHFWQLDPSEQQKFMMPFTGITTDGKELSHIMENEVQFYRMVRIFGIYNKRGNAETLCTNSTCPGDHPQELRFCVKVFRGGIIPGDVDLCSVLTNFKE